MTDYFESPYSNKLENPEEVNKFLEAFSLPKMNQGYKPLNRYLIGNETEGVIVYQQRKAQDPMESRPNSTRPFKN
jgi:hypothetical protein